MGRADRQVYLGTGPDGLQVALKRLVFPYEQQQDPIIRRKQEQDGVHRYLAQILPSLIWLDPADYIQRVAHIEAAESPKYCSAH